MDFLENESELISLKEISSKNIKDIEVLLNKDAKSTLMMLQNVKESNDVFKDFIPDLYNIKSWKLLSKSKQTP